ncbi:MAG: class I SAM-dependent methyltransferase [Patescibacteria group bacterium]
MKKNEYTQMADLEDHHWWFISKRNFIRVFITQFLGDGRKKIVDVGAGTGGITTLFSEWGKVTAVEKNQLAYEKLLRRKITAIKGSANVLPLQDTNFDLVAFCDVLYHKQVDEIKALSEAHRVLKHKGYIIVTDCICPWLWSKHDEAMEAKKRFRKKELEELIKLSGFKVLRSSNIFCFVFPLFILHRLVKKQIQSENYVDKVPSVLNAILKKIMKFEAWALKHVNLPFGSSVIILAQKS